MVGRTTRRGVFRGGSTPPRATGGPLYVLDQASAGEPLNRAVLAKRFGEFWAAFPGAEISMDAVGDAAASTGEEFRILLAVGTLPDVVATCTGLPDQYTQPADRTPSPFSE